MGGPAPYSQDPHTVVVALECIHDMVEPVSVTMRRLVKREGMVMVVDERVADAFGAFVDLIEVLLWGESVCML